MHGNLSPQIAGAIEHPVSCGSDAIGSDPDPSETDDESDWFAKIAWLLLGTNDCGFALNVACGSPESSCYKYVTKNKTARRQPPAYLIRTLLRSEQGWQWLCGIMDGAEPDWWRDTKRARLIKEAIDRIPAG